MRKLALILALTVQLAITETVLGSGCNGDACSVIYRVDSGGCIIFKNSGTRAVHVVFGNMSMTIAGGGTWKVMNIGGKSCLREAVGNPIANFASQH